MNQFLAAAFFAVNASALYHYRAPTNSEGRTLRLIFALWTVWALVRLVVVVV